MRYFRLGCVLISGLAAAGQVQAVEGPTAAGPIGGTDMRSALLPPPGLYGGTAVLHAEAIDFVDGNGKTIPALREGHLEKQISGTYLYYVPDLKVLGGAIGFGGMVVLGNQCGNLFAGESARCTSDVGDPYVQFDWSRSWAKPRSSQYPGAYPILEGLTVLLGVGVVIPVGQFDSSHPTEQALSIGTNIWDVAPAAAVTYTTAPFLAEGTEFSAKLFWNNYVENPETHYRTGDLLNLDFAVTERIGRWQVGLAGLYAVQVEDDRIDGIAIPPDGRQGELLQLGGVVNYDVPERGGSLKVKALRSIEAENTVHTWGVVGSWLQKF